MFFAPKSADVRI